MAQGLFNLKQVVQAVQQGGWPAQKPPAVDYLLVAGGGGSGTLGGGGGAGGVLSGVIPVANGQELLVTIGAGGVGGGNVSGTAATNSVFGNIAAVAGGKGGELGASQTYAELSGKSGGSGGGGCGFTVYTDVTGGQGTVNQGNNGGKSSIGAGGGATSGGGGGAGSAGYQAPVSWGGNGGAGIASAISGTVTAYGGGGGGGTYANSISGGGTGGVGGGGNGSLPNVNGVNGTPNTGGGGGGAGSTGTGGTGGSGIVFVSYPDTYAAPSATTGSPTVSTSGSGSAYFTGAGGVNGPYLEYAYSSSMQFGSGDFTLECWCYFNAIQESTILARYPFDGASNEWAFVASDTLIPSFFYSVTGGNSATSFVGPAALSLSTWYHFAVVRNGTVLTMYINGTSVATQTITGSIYSSGTPTTTFGSYAKTGVGPNGYAVPNGYLSNVRVVKGTAVYTSNFTPSTTPLTAISGTSMLLNTVSGAYTVNSSSNSTAPSAPSSYGPPTWNQLSPFTVTGYKNRVYKWTSSGSITF